MMRDRVTAPRLVPTEPPPDADKPPLWCRALGTHPWDVVPPILVMPGGALRVTLTCERCGSVKTQPWTKVGALGGHGQYRYSQAYLGLLSDTREASRKQVMTTTKTQPLSAYVRATETQRTGGTRDAANGAGLRLVSKAKRRVRDKPR